MGQPVRVKRRPFVLNELPSAWPFPKEEPKPLPEPEPKRRKREHRYVPEHIEIGG